MGHVSIGDERFDGLGHWKPGYTGASSCHPPSALDGDPLCLQYNSLVIRGRQEREAARCLRRAEHVHSCLPMTIRHPLSPLVGAYRSCGLHEELSTPFHQSLLLQGPPAFQHRLVLPEIR